MMASGMVVSGPRPGAVLFVFANTATQLMAALGSLAMANFDRAKAGADKVERPEIRIGAYLAIAQQAINPTERRMPSRW